MSKPPFDPSKPFETSAQAKPAFDPSKPFEASSGNASVSAPQGKSPDFASTLYHGAIEGGAMTVGGLAGAAMGSPAGPVGSAVGATALAASMYAPAKRAAEAIDRYRGITPPPQPGIAKEYGEGLAIEATGAAMRPIAKMAGKALSSAGETLSGAKKDVLSQAYRQGYSTYMAPSMEKAKTIFGEALGPEGRAAMKVPASEAFDASLGVARKTGAEMAEKMESGIPLSAIDALKGRQATDRVISATNITDRTARNALYGVRSQFDDALSSQSGPLKEASTKYRQAIVRNTLLNPTRITKSGKPSAFLPLVLGAGSRGLSGAVVALTATSPMVWGLGATTLGQISRGMTPSVQRGIYSQFIERVLTSD